MTLPSVALAIAVVNDALFNTKESEKVRRQTPQCQGGDQQTHHSLQCRVERGEEEDKLLDTKDTEYKLIALFGAEEKKERRRTNSLLSPMPRRKTPPRHQGERGENPQYRGGRGVEERGQTSQCLGGVGAKEEEDKLLIFSSLIQRAKRTV